MFSSSKSKNKLTLGFTLVELLVVISIIGLLSSIVLASVNSARIKARNTTRKEILVTLRNALELYYSKYGSYPQTTNDVPTNEIWYTSNSIPYTSSFSNNGGDWIPGLVASGAIASLPQDPAPTPGDLCPGTYRSFLYQSDGKNYKLLSHCAPEGEWDKNDSFNDLRRLQPWVIGQPSQAWMISSKPPVNGSCPGPLTSDNPGCW